MTLYNVSMVMTPNLFPGALLGMTPESEVLFTAKMTNVTQMLVKYQHILWTVSGMTPVSLPKLGQVIRAITVGKLSKLHVGKQLYHK